MHRSYVDEITSKMEANINPLIEIIDNFMV